MVENLKDYNRGKNAGINVSGIGVGKDNKTPAPQTSIQYGSHDKEQNTNPTFVNTEVTENGVKVDLEERGINTDIEKAQVVTKDEKVDQIDTKLHTDLANKEKRDELINDMKQLGNAPMQMLEAYEELTKVFSKEDIPVLMIIERKDDDRTFSLVSEDIDSYTGEGDKVLYGLKNGEKIYGKDLSGTINKIEEINNGTKKEEDVLIVIDGKKYFIYLNDAHYDINNTINAISSNPKIDYEFAGLIYSVEKNGKIGYAYTPAIGFSNQEGKRAQESQPMDAMNYLPIESKIIGAYHSHVAPNNYFNNYEEGIARDYPNPYFSGPEMGYSGDTGFAIAYNNIYNNFTLSLASSGEVKYKDTNKYIVPPESWIYDSTTKNVHYLGNIDDFKKGLNTERFEIKKNTKGQIELIIPKWQK